MGIFRRKSGPDWSTVEHHMVDGEKKLAALDAWLSGQSMGYDDDVDQPCTVFVTDARLVISVHPQTALPPAETIAAQYLEVLRFDIVEHSGGIRLMMLIRPSVSMEIFSDMMGETSEARGIAVDLPRTAEGRRVAGMVSKRVRRR